MISVMLVDDEPLAIKHLQNLIDWDGLGFSIVATASNGRRALEQFEVYAPQIVVSDIRMPVMDGLVLCRRVRERGARTVFVLLSAFRDFDYAKQAIQYGVSNYILKHELSAQTLTAELQKAREQMREWQSLDFMQRERHYKNLLLGSQAGTFEDNSSQYLLIIVQEDTPFAASHSIQDNESFSTLGEKLQQVTISHMEYVVGISIDSRHHAILFRENHIAGELRRLEAAHNCIDLLHNQLCDHANATYSILYETGIPQNRLAERFRGLSALSRYTVFKGRECLFHLGEQPIDEVDCELSFDTELIALENGAPVASCLDNLFRQITEPVWNHAGLRKLCASLDTLAARLAQQNDAMLPEMIPCWSAEELHCYYKTLFERLSEEATSRRNYSPLVRQCVEYIDRHYRQELTLEDLGGEFHVNGVYLGQLIKKEVGMTFLKYLTARRIEHAKRLLRDYTHNVSEISELVGYKSGQYFSQIFQKHAGMTPNQYRKWGHRSAAE